MYILNRIVSISHNQNKIHILKHKQLSERSTHNPAAKSRT